MPLPDQIGSVIIGPLVAAIVEALKAVGMPVSYAPWANTALAVVFWFIAQAFDVLPEYQTWIVAVLQILVIILTAAGFYEEAVKRVVKQRFNK